MNIRFSPEFRRDLRRLKTYLKQQGFKSADTIGKDILRSCNELKRFPEKGKSVSERFGIDIDMLFLVVGKNIIFYRIEDEFIEIVRMFDTRMDIMFRMFGIEADGSEEQDRRND